MINMRGRFVVFLGLIIGSGILSTAQSSRNTLAIQKIEASPTVIKKYVDLGKTDALERTLNILESQILESLNAKRVFNLLAQPAAKPISTDSATIITSDANSTGLLKGSGVQYLLAVTLTDLNDESLPLAQVKTNAKVDERV